MKYGEVGHVVCVMAVDLSSCVGIGGGGGDWCGCGGGVIVVVVVVVRIGGGDVDAGKAFQRGEESGRDGGAHPGSHLIDLLP